MSSLLLLMPGPAGAEVVLPAGRLCTGMALELLAGPAEVEETTSAGRLSSILLCLRVCFFSYRTPGPAEAEEAASAGRLSFTGSERLLCRPFCSGLARERNHIGSKSFL